MIRVRNHRNVATALLLLAACSKAGSGPSVASDEDRLRAEIKTWVGNPFSEKGTTHDGISNAGLVQQVFHNALGWDIPASRDAQYHTGKLVADRKALKPGDLVFLQGQGFGPFRARSVAIYVGQDEIAISTRGAGVEVVKLTDPRWSVMYETARHIPRDSAGAPAFEVAKYGSNKGALLHEIAKAWSGTLYLDNGTTFDGIGNFEYVRAIYEGVNDQELEGTPATWQKMGTAVKKEDLQPGDIILYQAVGLAALLNRLHAGMYIGGGEFTHCVKGSAVTTSKLDDPQWKAAFRFARRMDPAELAKAHETAAEAKRLAAEAKAEKARATKDTRMAVKAAPPKSVVKPADEPLKVTVAAPPSALGAPLTDTERKLRAATETWRGTPYKLGGTSKSGVDCSAFTRAVFNEALAKDLPRTAAEQETLGTPVQRENLATGDLVFFRTQGMGPFFKSRHVGVYLGGGEFAQASGSHGVVVSRLDEYYWNKKYVAARRLSVN
jgi:cell wall-associated NlpC family hydrolase